MAPGVSGSLGAVLPPELLATAREVLAGVDPVRAALAVALGLLVAYVIVKLASSLLEPLTIPSIKVEATEGERERLRLYPGRLTCSPTCPRAALGCGLVCVLPVVLQTVEATAPWSHPCCYLPLHCCHHCGGAPELGRDPHAPPQLRPAMSSVPPSTTPRPPTTRTWCHATTPPPCSCWDTSRPCRLGR